MSNQSDLESQVLALWHRCERAHSLGGEGVNLDQELWGALSVYADELQRADDPRGEMIALDLRGENSPASEVRKRDLLIEWLGRDLSNQRRTRIRYGLIGASVSEGDIDWLSDLVKSKGGSYIESIRMSGTRADIQRWLSSILSRPHPWLGRMSIGLRNEARTDRQTWVIANDLASELIRMIPELHSLEVSGMGLLQELPHPALLRIAVNGYDTVGALSGDGLAFPGVTELDFAFQAHGSEFDPTEAALRRLLPRSHFSMLRRLDLSRNEPGYTPYRHLGGSVDVFKFLHELPLCEQLTKLRLPVIRSKLDAERLQSVLDRMPELLEVESLRNHVMYSNFKHPLAELQIPPGVPWPPEDSCRARVLLAVLPREQDEIPVKLADAIVTMNKLFHRLDPSVQNAWTQVWNQLRELLDSDECVEASIPSDLFVDAILGCSNGFHDDGWRSLCAALSSRRNVAHSGDFVRMRKLGSADSWRG